MCAAVGRLAHPCLESWPRSPPGWMQRCWLWRLRAATSSSTMPYSSLASLAPSSPLCRLMINTLDCSWSLCFSLALSDPFSRQSERARPLRRRHVPPCTSPGPAPAAACTDPACASHSAPLAVPCRAAGRRRKRRRGRARLRRRRGGGRSRRRRSSASGMRSWPRSLARCSASCRRTRTRPARRRASPRARCTGDPRRRATRRRATSASWPCCRSARSAGASTCATATRTSTSTSTSRWATAAASTASRGSTPTTRRGPGRLSACR